MEEKEDSRLTLQAKEAIRRYMLTLIVIPGALLAIASFFLGFFINEVAKQGAYNEAYSQASGELMKTAAEAARTSGKIDGLHSQAKSLLAEAEETRKKVELSASDIASKVANELSNNSLFVEKASIPLTQKSNSFEQRLQGERNRANDLDKRVKFVENALIPAGTVLAFDQTSCPSGWAEFKKAYGRTIVGAGQSSESNALFKVGDKGGVESHVLTIEELPKHDHNANGAVSSSFKVTGSLPWFKDMQKYPIPVVVDEKDPLHDWSVGNNKAHNNMPPYVVLLYCKKI